MLSAFVLLTGDQAQILQMFTCPEVREELPSLIYVPTDDVNALIENDTRGLPATFRSGINTSRTWNILLQYSDPSERA